MSKAFTKFFDMRVLERSARGQHSLSRVHSLAKLIVTLAYIVFVLSFSTRDIGGLLVMSVYPIFMLILSDAAVKPVLTRLMPAVTLTFFACVANLFLQTEAAFQIGGLTVSVGVITLLSAVIKAILCVLSAFILIITTPLMNIVSALQGIRFPSIITTQVLLIYRYIDLLVSEASSMMKAYRLRGGGKGVKLKDMGTFLGSLLLRTVHRGERVYLAMNMRGFCGNVSVSSTEHFSAMDTLYIVALIGAFAAARFVNIPNIIGGIFV